MKETTDQMSEIQSWMSFPGSSMSIMYEGNVHTHNNVQHVPTVPSVQEAKFTFVVPSSTSAQHHEQSEQEKAYHVHL
jgi:hypothetical protein